MERFISNSGDTQGIITVFLRLFLILVISITSHISLVPDDISKIFIPHSLRSHFDNARRLYLEPKSLLYFIFFSFSLMLSLAHGSPCQKLNWPLALFLTLSNSVDKRLFEWPCRMLRDPNCWHLNL